MLVHVGTARSPRIKVDKSTDLFVRKVFIGMKSMTRIDLQISGNRSSFDSIVDNLSSRNLRIASSSSND